MNAAKRLRDSRQATLFACFAVALVAFSMPGTGFAACPDFATVTTARVGEQPIAITIGDFNRDSKPDLAVANSGSNLVSVLASNGDGTFTPGAHYFAEQNPISLAVGDLNGNGRIDLAVAGGGSSHLWIFSGNPVACISTVSPDSGSIIGGQPVVIRGANLGHTSSVTFGNVKAVITEQTETSITVITPAHEEGAVDVVVTSGAGSATEIRAYTYVRTKRHASSM